jgi:hypothetical protein
VRPASDSSSSAWAAAASLPGSPASILESSSTLSASSSTSIDAVPPSFRTRMCRSANDAICGRWVTTMTCRPSARFARRRPTATPATPPIPASTSSKIKRRHVVQVDEHAPAPEHRARELPARRDLRERLRGLPRPAREHEDRVLGPAGDELRVRDQGHLDRGALHPELAELPSERAREPGHRGGATVRDRRGERGDALGRSATLAARAPAPARRRPVRRGSPVPGRGRRAPPPSPLPYLRWSASSAPIRSRTSCSRAGSSSSRSR